MPRTPIFIQAQQTECCIAVLAAMLGHFGRWVTLAELRALTGISRDCLSVADMARAARHYGLDARVLRKEPEALASLGLPLIVHLDFVHFAVLERLDADTVCLNDPAQGPLRLARAVFDERFTGIVLHLTPGPQFAPGGQPPRLLPASLAVLAPPARRALGWALLPSLLLPLAPLGLAALAWRLPDAVTLAGAALAAGAARFVLKTAQLRARQHAAETVRRTGEARFAASLAQQPQPFFDYRLPGALGQAARLPQMLGDTLCRQLLPGATAAAEALALLAAFVWLAPGPGLLLAGVLLLALLLGAWLQRRGGWRLPQLLSEGQAGAPYRANGIDASRTGGAAAAQQAADAGAVAAGLTRRQWLLGWAGRVGLLQQAALLAVVALLAGVAPLPAPSRWLALALLAAPLPWAIAPLLRLPAALREWRIGLALLADAMPAAPAEPAAPSAPAGAPASWTAHGLVFGYSASRAPLLDGVTLDIAPGELVGLAGASGAGKSTLAALLCGLARPWQGAVRHGAQELAALDAAARARVVAWVDKHPAFFTGSVRSNLCLWDAPIDDAALREALDDACLLDTVMARPGGLEAAVAPRAANFSGGQRQRLAIARALARGPRLLILDEATDGLDVALEAALLARLRRRGCSVILISHRAASLAACDRVLHLAHGRIAGAAADLPAAPPPPSAIDAVAPEASMPLPDAQRVQDCLQRLAARCGLAWRTDGAPPAASATRAGMVQALAAAGGMPLRPVRMTAPRWWRADPGPLLVFAQGEPALLLPGPGRRQVLVGADGVPHPVAAPAALLGTQAWAPLPGAPSPAWRSLRQALTGQLGEGGRALPVALAAAGGGGALAVMAGCAVLLAGWPAAACVAAAALLWQCQAQRALARALGRLQFRSEVRWLDLQGRLPLALLGGDLAPRLAASAASSLLRVLWDARRAGPPLAAAAGALLACGVAFICLWPAAWAAWLAAVALSLLPLAWCGGAPRARLRYPRAARLRDGFLLHLLHRIGSLRALGAATGALQHWLAMPQPAPPGRWRLAALRAWGEAMPLALAGLLCAATLAWPQASPPGARWLAALLLLAFSAALCQRLCAGAWAWRQALEARRVGQLAWRAQREPVAPPCADAPPLRLDAEGLGFTWPGSATPALRDVSLSLAPGRIVALAGASGSGKSTLLRLLLGFLTPGAGRLLVDGVPLAADGAVALRAAAGVVLQDQELEGAGPLRWQLDDAGLHRLDSVWQALERVALAQEVRAMPMGVLAIVDSGRLPSGQLQRLLIARCLLARPRLLILDEATSAVPDAQQAHLLAQLRALGVGCLLVSHRASTLAAADEVVVLAEGRVAARGAPGSAAVQAALGTLVEPPHSAPLATPAAPPVAGPALRPLFRVQALRHFQGDGKRHAPLLLPRAWRWPAWLAGLLLAAAAWLV